MPKPLPRQVMWQDCEVGVIFHLDMPVFCEGGWAHDKAVFHTYDPRLYNPVYLDTDQWLDTAKAMGAKYAVFTATHFNGFLQWQSDIYPYGLRQASWRSGRGDVVADFVASCHRYGIRPALYLSCFRNAWWKVDQYRVNYGKGGEEQARFARTCEQMVEELCSRYGELLQIWFDAGLIFPAEGGPDVLPTVDKYQPNMVFYHSPQRREHRWIGNESGYAGYPCWATMPDLTTAERAHKEHTAQNRALLEHGDRDGRLWSPAMVDTVVRDHHWCWRPNTEGTIEPLENLVQFYYDSVGRNANLVLGLVIDPTGLVPEPDAKRCRQFGQEIRRRFGTSLARVSGSGHCVELPLSQPARIDHVSIMEDIVLGERIREYVVEGLTPEGSWQQLCQGISVGHKRIQRFRAQDVRKIRLRVTHSVAAPVIRDLAVYYCG
jgi:alpha-L-fucosidase